MDEDIVSSNTPLTPPTSEETRVLWLRLIRSRRVGVSTFFRLMREYGGAAQALEALPEIAAKAGVPKYTICPEGVVRAEMAAARRAGATALFYGDAHYPKTLMDISDAPPVIWSMGDTSLLNRPMVALVGARNASSLGQRMTKRLAAELGEAGVVVVSGLARGIDTAAHVAALPTGTIAVQAGGIDQIYPTQNRELAHDIAHQGLRLAEDAMGVAPKAQHFPRRNRIVSGLAQAVVVVEAAAKSGSLLTAQTALDQGRDVMAVPGHPMDGRASGCNILLRDGARLVRSAEDILENLTPVTPPPDPVPQPQLDLSPAPQPDQDLSEVTKLHQEILNRLGPSPLAEDQLIRDLNLPVPRVSGELVTLEIEGKIERMAGGYLARIH